MSYVVKYTSVDNIARRLRGRLNVNINSGQLINAASGTVDDLLISQVAEQVESKLELALGQIYEVPISQSATFALQIIGAIAEKLIVAEIALTHFQTQLNPETGADMGFGNALRKQAFEDAEAIFGGHGIYVPGIMNRPPNSPATGEAKQPLVLPGVRLLSSSDRPDTFSRNDSFVFGRESLKQDELWS
jgi:hypothetical protein